MTTDQKFILGNLIADDGDGVYHIRSIEYPSHATGQGMSACVKVVTEMTQTKEWFADWYSPDGRTIETRSWFEFSIRV